MRLFRPRPQWLTERPIAHRGLHDEAAGVTENTGAAFEAAIAGGYAIECDVRAATDGIVVFHDATLDRLTEGRGDIVAQTTADLQRMRFRGGSVGIPTLAALLGLADGRVPLFVEIKADPRHPPGARRLLADAVATEVADYVGPLALMSFDAVTVSRLRQSAPHLPVGYISAQFANASDDDAMSAGERFSRRHILPAFRLTPDFVAYDVKGLPAPGPSLWRQFGLPLLTWTVRSEADRQVAAACADQMIFEGFRPGV